MCSLCPVFTALMWRTRRTAGGTGCCSAPHGKLTIGSVAQFFLLPSSPPEDESGSTSTLRPTAPDRHRASDCLIYEVSELRACICSIRTHSRNNSLKNVIIYLLIMFQSSYAMLFSIIFTTASAHKFHLFSNLVPHNVLNVIGYCVSLDNWHLCKR